MSIHNKVLAAVKSVEKTDPKERVGVFCRKNKKVGVVEYTEISEQMANLRDDYGSLVYGDANAIFHLYNIKGLEKVSELSLPYHTAIKKANYIDANGKEVTASKPNAYKFEMFIFDSYEMFDDVVVLRVKREEEFAPIKNAEGQDSPETARKLYKDYMNKVEYTKKYKEWSTSPVFDLATRQELLSIAGDEGEIKDRFYKDLEFGTAGMRGVIGNGTNRMNVYTVTKATQGLANYILRQGTENKGVVIAYDSRNMSSEFSQAAALCLNANGIKTYIFDSLRPVPELSFAVRQLGCTAGVMVTASHNPPEYNGYKVYWDDGAQIVPPHDKEIIAEVNRVKDYSLIRSMTLDEAMKARLYNIIGPAMDKLYLEAIKKQILNPDVIKEQNDLRIVYTPLHGTGNLPVQNVLKELGFKNVFVVPEQELPNGNFPTVDYPNPEDKNAFKMALDLAKEKDADLVLATDPDADRLGIAVEHDGEYVLFTGNQTAALVFDYICKTRKELGTLPKDGYMFTTNVSSTLPIAIAQKYGLKVEITLTGFKFIGEKAREMEETGRGTYVFGFEESYGCLVSDCVRDKDSIQAILMLCETAAYYREKGMDLVDALNAIYKEYGYYLEGITNIGLAGLEGKAKIGRIMDFFRTTDIALKDFKILAKDDVKLSVHTDYCNNDKKTKIELPTSNVIKYYLNDNMWFVLRPSGTEPKLKVYYGVVGKSDAEAKAKLEALKSEVMSIVNLIK
jgi:phosphoglucomutase